jgi:signal transduction histidine kinase
MPDLAALVGESRRAGVAVRAHYRLVEPHTLWPEAGRGAYRIVQEALTNARKHAPGQPVTVTVDGSAARGLRIEIRNPMPVPGVGETSGRAGPTGGTGLVGLIERAALAGGALRHERTTDGEFCVTAWLPWAPGDGSRPSRVRRCEAPVSGLARTGVSGG